MQQEPPRCPAIVAAARTTDCCGRTRSRAPHGVWFGGRSDSTHHFQPPGEDPERPRLVIHTPKTMNTTIKAALRADWAPAIESTARAIGVAIAVLIVATDWLRFTWQHPWAGLRALEFPGAAPSSSLSAASSPQSERVAPLLLLPAPAFLLLAPAPEPIAPVPAPRKRGRRATRQPKVTA